MTILIDIDSTITNFSEVLLNYLNKNKIPDKNSITYHDYSEINSYDWFEETYCDPWNITRVESFWDKVEVNLQAVKYIEHWVKQHRKVYLCSASWIDSVLNYKIFTTLKPFDEKLINKRNIIITQDKSIIKGDVLIDDAPHNILSFPACSITYAQPWNQNIPYPHSILRTNDWNKIDTHIRRIEYAKPTK